MFQHRVAIGDPSLGCLQVGPVDGMLSYCFEIAIERNWVGKRSADFVGQLVWPSPTGAANQKHYCDCQPKQGPRGMCGYYRFELLIVSWSAICHSTFHYAISSQSTLPAALTAPIRDARAWDRQMMQCGKSSVNRAGRRSDMPVKRVAVTGRVSIHMFLNDLFRQTLPRPFLMHVVGKRCSRGRKSVIDHNVGFRNKALEQLG